MSLEALLSLQRAFRDAVLGMSRANSISTLRADGPVENRISVYRNTVQASLIDVLAAAYPIVARIMGRGAFEDLARSFVGAQPPRRAYLSSYGGDFPAFIAVDGIGSELPYLAEVAHLEWARGEAYFADDALNLDPSRLGALTPDALSATVLVLHPATRLMVSNYPIHRIWQVNHPNVADVPPVDMTVPENVLISRSALRVTVRPIAAADAAFVAAIQGGATMAAAVSRVQLIDPAFDLERALRDHLIDGTFRN